MSVDIEQVRRLVDSAVEQGLPATVTDTHTLAIIATLVGHATKVVSDGRKAA